MTDIPTTPASGDEPALSDERIERLERELEAAEEARNEALAIADQYKADYDELAARQSPAAPAGDRGDLPALPVIAWQAKDGGSSFISQTAWENNSFYLSQYTIPLVRKSDAHAALNSRQSYPLPDSLYPGSKDWLSGDYAARVEWLHTMYEARKADVERLEDGEPLQQVAVAEDVQRDAVHGHWDAIADAARAQPEGGKDGQHG